MYFTTEKNAWDCGGARQRGIGKGYALRWLRREPAIYSVLVRGKDGETKLEWVVDSDFRFFPTMRDADFGDVLHPVDLAMHKVLAAAGRREVRDLIDLVTIQENILPLGVVVWAAVEKSPGFTPEGLLEKFDATVIIPRRNGGQCQRMKSWIRS
jgi:hypothetical protein